MDTLMSDESGYVEAIILLMSTILMAFIIVIAIMPVHDQLESVYTNQLIESENQFFTEEMSNRLSTGGDLGWKAPFGFIAIGFIYAIIRVIKKQRYTRYGSDEEYR